ncbi:MAG TPA: flagellar basal-body MS-ring/collar protein FliF [Jatrophihabitans sp.]|jgi:flagellar M-ring protein FliF
MSVQEKALGFAQKLWNDFKAFTPGQKAATTAAILALVVGGVLFSTWKSKPNYAPLYTNLAASDAQAIIDKLNAAGTPYQLGGDGTSISVPQDKVYTSRIALSADGLPGSTQNGYDLLDQEGVTTSEFKQQVDYQRAVEGELDKTIMSVNGINNAQVHLAIPQQDVFNDGSQKPTASVLLTTAANAQLTSEQVQSIAYLVSSAVPQMDATAVTITDQKGQILNSPDSTFNGTAGSSGQDTQTADYDSRIKTQLQGMIDTVLGPGHAQVVYNAVLDYDKKTTTSNQYTLASGSPLVPLSVQTSSEKYSGTQAGTGGVLGANPTPSAAAVPGGGADSYTKNDGTVNNPYGTVQETVQTAPGAVKQQNVSVVLDAAVPAANVQAIQNLVSSAIGLNTQRGDTINVQALAFSTAAQTQQQAADAAAAQAAAAKAAKDRQASLIKEAAVAGVALITIITFLVMRRRKRKKAAAPPAEEFEAWWDDPYLPTTPEATAPEAEELAAELSEAQARRRALITLANEQPDDVARVLSSWLNS